MVYFAVAMTVTVSHHTGVDVVFTVLLQWLSHHTGVKVVVHCIVAMAVPPYRCESCGSLYCCNGCPTIQV